ncbi:MAG: hypothetical protein AAFU83_02995, partial [Bacteroidota bacterium]
RIDTSRAQGPDHKLIVTSRHDISQDCSFDQRVDLVGLSARISPETVEERFLTFINEDIQRQAIMSSPINRRILHYLWPQFSTELMHQDNQPLTKGLCRLYEYFTEHGIRDRLEVHQESLQYLELIAFQNMQPKPELDILPKSLKDKYSAQGCTVCATVSEMLLQDNLSTLETIPFLFQHLIFKQYFASGFLASKFLMSTNSGNGKELTETFIKIHKNNPRFYQTFALMIARLSNGDYNAKLARIREILQLLRRQEEGSSKGDLARTSNNSIGLHDLVLQLRLVNEWLTRLPQQERLDGLKEINREFRVLEALNEHIDSSLTQLATHSTWEPITKVLEMLQNAKAIVSLVPKKTLSSFMKAIKDSSNPCKQKSSINVLLKLCEQSTLFADKVSKQLSEVLYIANPSRDSYCRTILEELVKIYHKSLLFKPKVQLLLTDALAVDIGSESNTVIEGFFRKLHIISLIDMYFETQCRSILERFVRPLWIDTARVVLSHKQAREEQNYLLVLNEGTNKGEQWERPREEMQPIIDLIT